MMIPFRTRLRFNILTGRNLRKPSECWPWKGGMNNKGYGKFKFLGKTVSAHRIAFLFEYGYLPKKPHEVCHTCDNPPCCNPTHLFEGTRSDNMRDCVKKGRSSILKAQKLGNFWRWGREKSDGDEINSE
jgi:hypothetical protein